MPHDQSGTLLNPGDIVLLRCKVIAVHEGESGCNLTTEAADRPEGESYIPQISGNSRFYEKFTPPPPPTPLLPVDFEVRPYLYLDRFGPQQPVVFTRSRDAFVWDPVLQRHVRDFPSVEEFDREQKRILRAETRWTIFAGIRIIPKPQPPAPEQPDNSEDDLPPAPAPSDAAESPDPAPVATATPPADSPAPATSPKKPPKRK